MVPIELIRLRSATATYLSILLDSLPQIEALAKREELSIGPMADVQEAIEAAIQLTTVPGTPASIRQALAVLLGETTPPDRPPPRRPACGSVLPHHGASPPLDDGGPATETSDGGLLMEEQKAASERIERLEARQ